MKGNHFGKKGLVVGIIILFIGTSIVTAFHNNLVNEDIIKSPNESSLREHIAYGFSVYGFVSGFIQFSLDDPGNLTVIDPNGSATGADFDDNGDLYYCTFDGSLWKIEYETGDVIFIGNTLISLNGLTHDTTTDIWYACTNYSIYTVDITTAATTLVGNTGMSNILIGLACDYDGTIYSYDVQGSGHSTLYSIDKTNGHAIAIGDMGYGFLYAQDPAYDRDNDVLYIAGYFNDGMPSALLTCNTQTGACTMVGLFPGGIEIDGFAIPYGNLNQHPHADFTWKPTTPNPGETILFNASTSYDSDGYITLYEWDWNNDGVYEESHPTPTATYFWTNPGEYQVTLRVTDNASSTGKTSKTIHIINPPPAPPEIHGPTYGRINVAYTFFTDPITDPDEDSFYCLWDWGDGNFSGWLGPYSSGTIATATHQWSQPRIYEIHAKIKDTSGAQSNWSAPFTIYITSKVFLIGLIRNANTSENVTILNMIRGILITFHPIDLWMGTFPQVLLLNTDSRGYIGSRFIIGRFYALVI